ncbi:MAG: phosphate/phosphite/phosphonate ABC transporter substrate-binding protein [Deltaproteobacteria bacterium]|nr:phosphate/phosphite/phosphonate ABC transporter substrate-binding protein [Deltaproteobacteria bacterium]MBW2661361.1 phosphate/phosphite/phosphonate ABC transporter substrate-binding protein [Deltaproteobacteria bacterium]
MWLPAIIVITTLIFFGCDNGSERKEIDLKDTATENEIQKHAAVNNMHILKFGFDLRASPQEDAEQYLPFLRYLEEATGYKFDLRFTPRGSNIVDDLGQGTVQLAAIGARSYIEARARYKVVPLVHGLNIEGKAEYRSVIFTASKSRIKKIEDLRGKRFAFGNVRSTQGHIIPRIMLAESGLTLNDFSYCKYTGSHRNCANAVTAGRFDAGGMQDIMGKSMEADGLIRIIKISRYYPSSSISVNKNVPAEKLARIKQALLDFDPKGRHKAGLYHWERTEMANGFCEAKDEDYAELRDWIRKFSLLCREEEAAAQ